MVERSHNVSADAGRVVSSPGHAGSDNCSTDGPCCSCAYHTPGEEIAAQVRSVRTSLSARFQFAQERLLQWTNGAFSLKVIVVAVRLRNRAGGAPSRAFGGASFAREGCFLVPEQPAAHFPIPWLRGVSGGLRVQEAASHGPKSSLSLDHRRSNPDGHRFERGSADSNPSSPGVALTDDNVSEAKAMPFARLMVGLCRTRTRSVVCEFYLERLHPTAPPL
jgi:hypothetical protein